MASVKLTDVKKVYDNNVTAVHDFNLDIKDKEFVVFVGPSGCGKSTTLRMIAGLEDISDGTLTIGDRVVNDVEPKDRDIAMVFQNYALYPHITVYENMAFSLRLRKMSNEEIHRRVCQAADILGIPGISTLIDLYTTGREIKSTLEEGDLGVSGTALIISDIASILGLDTLASVTGLVDDVETIKASLDKEAGAYEKAEGKSAVQDVVEVVSDLISGE